MSNRFLFVWWVFSLIGASLCQYYKNILIVLISVSVIIGSVIVFLLNRIKDYHKKSVLKYKSILIYEIITMIIVSFSLMKIGIFDFNKDDGVYFWVYFLHFLPLLPIIINTAWINSKNKK